MRKVIALMLLFLASTEAHAAKNFAKRYPTDTALEVLQANGSFTSGNCLQTDASGNVVDAGSACGSGGGSPGGSPTNLQYNFDGSSFGGITGSSYSVTTGITYGGTLTLGQSGGIDGLLNIKNSDGDILRLTTNEIVFDEVGTIRSAGTEEIVLAAGSEERFVGGETDTYIYAEDDIHMGSNSSGGNEEQILWNFNDSVLGPDVADITSNTGLSLLYFIGIGMNMEGNLTVGAQDDFKVDPSANTITSHLADFTSSMAGNGHVDFYEPTSGIRMTLKSDSGVSSAAALILSSTSNEASLLWDGGVDVLYITSGGDVNFLASGTFQFQGAISQVGGYASFNTLNGDYDFIVNGDNIANLFYIDASTDRIGLKTPTPTSTFDLNSSGLGVTQDVTKGLSLSNSTAAAAGAQQMSPSSHLQGKGWATNSGGSSQSVDYVEDLLPVQGTANPSSVWQQKFAVNGGAYSVVSSITSTGTLSTNSIRLGDGTATNPSHSFTSDPQMGMYKSTTNTLGFSTSGTEVFKLTTNGAGFYSNSSVIGPSGTASFANATTTIGSTGTVTVAGLVLSQTSTSGQLLRSAGTNGQVTLTTSTFPSAAAAGGSILRGSGGNWAQTSMSYPDVITNGRVAVATATNTLGQSSSDFTFSATTGTVSIGTLTVTTSITSSNSVNGTSLYLTPTTVAGLGAATQGRIRFISDGLTFADCTVGGGTNAHICQADGAVWKNS